mmetsp:Transcript_3545/g.5938  ORF Transcript_3545/g.5938 Transcript_3545/m.5938 type:complete len:299 (-) Transcript_3545:17-913(-)
MSAVCVWLASPHRLLHCTSNFVASLSMTPQNAQLRLLQQSLQQCFQRFSQGLKKDWRFIDHGLMPHCFLDGKPRDTQHGQSSILNFCQLQRFPRLGLRQSQIQWIPSQITWRIVHFVPRSLCLERINGGGQAQTETPKFGTHLFEATIKQRWNAIVIVQNGGNAKEFGNGAIQQFRCGPASSSQHSQPSMLDFNFTVIVERIMILGEAQGIETKISSQFSGEHGRSLQERNGLTHFRQCFLLHCFLWAIIRRLRKAFSRRHLECNCHCSFKWLRNGGDGLHKGCNFLEFRKTAYQESC